MKKILFILFIAFFGQIKAKAVTCNVQDSLQLVSINTALGGANWTTKWNFNTPVSTWFGVTLTPSGSTIGSVKNLSLGGNNLVGQIPNFVLPNLQTLWLHQNQLSGSIPNFVLPNLQSLTLQNNQLSGAIPNFVLPNLQVLSLSFNQLNGTIPNFVLPNLQYLDLSGNQLSGAIPNFVLPKLIELYLYNNQLSGAIPNFVLPNLQYLDLSGNQLSGSIPNITFSSSNYYFGVSNNLFNFGNINNAWTALNNANYQNGISGYAPQNTLLPTATLSNGILTADLAGMSNASQLTYTWYKNGTAAATVVGNNQYIPYQAGTYTYNVTHATITQLSIAGKNLILSNTAGAQVTTPVITHPIPTGLAACLYDDFIELDKFYTATNGDNWYTKTGWFTSPDMENWYGIDLTSNGCDVKVIDLSVNLANINSGYGNNLVGSLVNFTLPNLQSLYLSNNQLSGTIPNFVLPNLQQLGLYSNKLSGSIPNFVLPNLAELGLSYNQLSGTIPSFTLPNLQVLSLRNNILFGTIPSFNLPNLQQLDLYYNQLSGTIPDFTLPNLQYLLLTKNSLSGVIPNFTLPKLQSLYLNNNQLSGTIPNFVLPNLKYLHLSNNQLSGPIPNFVLPNLQNLNLSNNQLSGLIPNFVLPNLQYLYLNNNQLSGLIPNFVLPNLQYLDLSGNQLSGAIPNFVLPNLQALWLYNNQLSGTIPNITFASSIYFFNVSNNLFNFGNINNAWTALNNANYQNNASGYAPQNTLLPTATLSNGILTADLAGMSNASQLTYTWYKNGTAAATVVGNNQYIPYQAGTYTYSVTHGVITQPSNVNKNLILSNTAGAQVTTPVITHPIPTGLAACLYDDFIELDKFYTATNGDNWYTKTGWFTDPNMENWYGIDLTSNGCDVKVISLWQNTANLSGVIGNNLFGTIPNFTLPNLQVLDLSYNILYGTIPNFTLPNLQLLSLRNNILFGPIQNFTLPNLVTLDLSNNQLSGIIPDFTLPNLKNLLLTKNSLSGVIPNFTLPNLQWLYLDYNKLSGAIPNFVLPNLQVLYLSNNQLSGTIPNFVLPNLQGLYLYTNQLSGTIPNFVLPNLQYLDLSGNQLSGAIPNFVLPNLQHLYLSFNQLSGTIPNITFSNSNYYFSVQNNLFNFGNTNNAWTALNNANYQFGNSGYAPQKTLLPAATLSNGILTADLAGMSNALQLTYTWYKNGLAVATVVGNNQHLPTQTGTYTYSVSHAVITQPSNVNKNLILNSMSTLVCPPSSITTSVTSPTCFGGNNGTITTSISGGVAPYTYLWSNGSTTATLTNLVAGAYTLTVSDINTCSASASVTITAPTVFNIYTSKSDVTCFNSANGSASATASGGTAPYTYTWSNGATSNVITGLMIGNYTVTISDAKGCSIAENITINQPTVLTTSTTKIDIPCFGGNTGTTTVNPSGGTLPYTYSWSNGVTTAHNNNLVAGIYTVTVIDAKGCSSLSSVTITAPTNMVINAAKTNVSCNSGNNGTITTSISGGTAPYTYNWSNGANTANRSSLTAGTYTVTVTDLNGCTKSTSVTITQPSLMVISITKNNLLCSYSTNGMATASVSGGVAPYSYAWSNGSNTTTIGSLLAGTYTVTVTDANQCSNVKTVTIQVPSPISITIISENISCFGGNNGKVVATTIGGTPPYSSAWNTPQTTQLSAGIYTVTMTDANGCSAVKSATLTQPSEIALTTTSMNVSCATSQNGQASVSVTGGTSGYSYKWSNQKTTATITGLGVGTYTVTVTDAKLCTKTATISIITNPAINIDSVKVIAGTIASCPSNVNATLKCFATWTGALSYQWYNSASGVNPFIPIPNQTANTLQINLAGHYKCKVSNGCVDQFSTTIVATGTPKASIVTDNCVDHVMTVTSNSNVNAIAYQWQKMNSASCGQGNPAIIIGATQSTYLPKLLLPPQSQLGSYKVIVTFAGGCLNISDDVCVFIPSCPSPQNLTSPEDEQKKFLESLNLEIYQPEFVDPNEIFPILDENRIILENSNEIATLDISPNPTKELLRIHFSLIENGMTQLNIMDMRGVKTLIWKEYRTIGEYNEILEKSIQNLPAGMYFVELATPTKIITKKLIKID
jgi:Leucine-rich repeat (LRR) protein